jgi:integrase
MYSAYHSDQFSSGRWLARRALRWRLPHDWPKSSRTGFGVFELAAVTDPAAVPHAVAAVLGITQQPGKTVIESVAAAYVASDEQGIPYHPNLLTFRWGRMLDGLRITPVRLHDARHSCATLMHLRGVPIAVIAAWLGHASAAFTMSVYTHSQDDALKSAASSFGRVVTTRDIETGSGG